METKELIKQAEINRRRLIEVVYNAKAGHIGGDLSCLNVMTALYFDIMNVSPADVKNPDRDRFVLSKGHCVEALYVTLEAKGFLKKEITDTLGKFGSILSGHPTIEVPGIEVNTGAPRTLYRSGYGTGCQDGQERLQDLCDDGRRRAGRRLYL